MAQALSLGLASPIAIEAPFAALHKADVIRLGAALGVPFELTLSCMQPIDGCTAAAAASAASGAMGFERRESPIRRVVSQRGRNAESAGFQRDRAVAGLDAKRACRPRRAAAQRARAFARRDPCRPTSRDPATSSSLRMPPSPVWASSSALKSGADRARRSRRRSRSPSRRPSRRRVGAIDDRPVAGVHLAPPSQLAFDVDAAVAGLERQPAFRAVDSDRAVAGVQHQLAFHVGRRGWRRRRSAARACRSRLRPGWRRRRSCATMSAAAAPTRSAWRWPTCGSRSPSSSLRGRLTST